MLQEAIATQNQKRIADSPILSKITRKERVEYEVLMVKNRSVNGKRLKMAVKTKVIR